MVIIDEQGHEIQDPDLSLGHLKEYQRLVAHHDAIEYQPPVYSEVVVKEYDNGGVLKERKLVTPAVEAQDAWDEYEDVLLYVLYTEEELADLISSNDEQQAMAKQVEAIAEAAAQRDSQIAQLLNLVPKAAALSTAASRAISFTKKTWVDDPTSGTPITAADMNRLEQAIVDLNTTLTSVQNSLSQTVKYENVVRAIISATPNAAQGVIIDVRSSMGGRLLVAADEYLGLYDPDSSTWLGRLSWQ